MSKQKLDFKKDRQTLLEARAVLVKHLDTMPGFPGASRGLMKIIGSLDEYIAALNGHLADQAKAKQP
ncbi:MAG: hypothetical protein IBX71_10245 [Candidatus Desulforudis sp.]|nr:hypothetical protein [Desulforudis sp.]